MIHVLGKHIIDSIGVRLVIVCWIMHEQAPHRHHYQPLQEGLVIGIKLGHVVLIADEQEPSLPDECEGVLSAHGPPRDLDIQPTCIRFQHGLIQRHVLLQLFRTQQAQTTHGLQPAVV